MLKRLARRPYHTATWAVLSSFSLIACTPRGEAPVDCQQLSADYAVMNTAAATVTESQRLLQQGVKDAINTAGFRTTQLRDDLLLVVSTTEVRYNGPEGAEIATEQHPVSLGTARENGVNYPLYLALRLGDAATGMRADGLPSYGLMAVSDMGTIVDATADGSRVTFSPEPRALTEAQMASLPQALRDLDRSLLPNDWISLAELHAQQVPIITGQGRVVARHMDAIEEAQRKDPSRTERCERQIFAR